MLFLFYFQTVTLSGWTLISMDGISLNVSKNPVGVGIATAVNPKGKERIVN